jgi:hypothetical protein
MSGSRRLGVIAESRPTIAIAIIRRSNHVILAYQDGEMATKGVSIMNYGDFIEDVDYD